MLILGRKSSPPLKVYFSKSHFYRKVSFGYQIKAESKLFTMIPASSFAKNVNCSMLCKSAFVIMIMRVRVGMGRGGIKNLPRSHTLYFVMFILLMTETIAKASLTTGT